MMINVAKVNVTKINWIDIFVYLEKSFKAKRLMQMNHIELKNKQRNEIYRCNKIIKNHKMTLVDLIVGYFICWKPENFFLVVDMDILFFSINFLISMFINDRVLIRAH